MSVTLIYVNEIQLRALYLQKTPFIIAFMRDHCPDSMFAMDYFLCPYINDYQDDKYVYVYEFERNGHLDALTMTYKDSYQAFLDEYHLSAKTNPVFGYRNGRVPSFQYVIPRGVLPNIDNSIIKDNCVIYNDTAVEIRGKIYIDETFFDGTRPLQYTSVNLKGREIAAYRRQVIGELHNDLAKSFFDYYLPKLTKRLLIDQ